MCLTITIIQVSIYMNVNKTCLDRVSLLTLVWCQSGSRHSSGIRLNERCSKHRWCFAAEAAARWKVQLKYSCLSGTHSKQQQQQQEESGYLSDSLLSAAGLIIRWRAVCSLWICKIKCSASFPKTKHFKCMIKKNHGMMMLSDRDHTVNVFIFLSLLWKMAGLNTWIEY